jgi:hypothetical protein
MSAQTETRTAAACCRDSCHGCALEDKLLCQHTPRDLFDFAVLAIGYFIPFLAGMALGDHWTGLIVWLVLAAFFFVYLEALVLCRHCPHYAEEGFTLRCHANYGLPKIPRFDPRPLNQAEKAIFLAYVSLLALYYVPFLVLSAQWLLLILTTWALLTWVWTLLRTQCTRCYHLSCPLNRVPDDVRRQFFDCYPAFREALDQADRRDERVLAKGG